MSPKSKTQDKKGVALTNPKKKGTSSRRQLLPPQMDMANNANSDEGTTMKSMMSLLIAMNNKMDKFGSSQHEGDSVSTHCVCDSPRTFD